MLTALGSNSIDIVLRISPSAWFVVLFSGRFQTNQADQLKEVTYFLRALFKVVILWTPSLQRVRGTVALVTWDIPHDALAADNL
jgi:hypothetical protein